MALVIHGLADALSFCAQPTPLQQGIAGLGLVEDAMDIRAHDLIIAADGAIGVAIEAGHRPGQSGAGGDTVMHFITGKRCWDRRKDKAARHFPELLARDHSCGHIQQAQAFCGAGFAFQCVRVLHRCAQHLKATTNAEHLTSVAQMFLDGLRPTLLAQPGQIMSGTFAAG